MSKKLWHPTSGALLAGCLMVTSAHAQEQPITPTMDPLVPQAPLAIAPVPERVAASTAPRVPTLELSFSDISVKKLLSILGQEFGINLSVNADVDGVIGSINLANTTPDEALQIVAETAGNLSVTRGSNGAYIVRKRQLGALPQNMSQGGFPGDFTSSNSLPIMPSNNFGLPNGQNGSEPPMFGGGGFGNTGVIDATGGSGRALSGLGQQQMNPMLAGLPTLVEANSTKNENYTRPIRVKNVPSSLMAFWLDPAHNAAPSSVQLSRENVKGYGKQPLGQSALGGTDFGLAPGFVNSNNSFPVAAQVNPYLRNSASGLIRPEISASAQFGGGQQGGFGGRGGQQGGFGGAGGQGQGGGGSFELPGDIQQIVSVDPQNVLLVAGGSDEDIRRLQELIDVLDQPLRQVEIEAQFVELSSQDARTFGIDFQTARGNFDAATTGFASAPVPGSIQVGFVRNNFTARVQALEAKNRAKVITAPRVTAINNLTASLTSTETRPLILTNVTQNITGGQQAGQQFLGISTRTGLVVTPTINGDDTITVLMQPFVENQGGTTGLGNITARSLLTVANVRDGDTIALGGLKAVSNTRNNFKVPILGDIPLIGKLFQSNTIAENESELIIFLTARIIRRAGDEVQVPGT